MGFLPSSSRRSRGRGPTPLVYSAAVETNDPPTVQDIARGYQTQLGASFVLVTNRMGGVLYTVTGSPNAADITPHLWRFLSRDPKDVSPELRKTAMALLNRMYPGVRSDSRRPEAELVALAQKFYNHKARYIGAKSNPDGSPASVPLWFWDDKALKLNRLPDVPIGQAEEYFGLRYARWALESKPEYAPAQALVLSLAAERAVERARFGYLATAEPAVYKLLADAPSPVLNDLLSRGLAQTGRLADSSSPLEIGGSATDGGAFAGLIDDVRVYNVALTAAQIQSDMTTPVATAPPVTAAPLASAATTVGGGARGRVTEQDIIKDTQPGPRATLFEDSVGIGFYMVDIHPCGANERGRMRMPRPFQIPMSALLPRETLNFLPASKAIGVTHLTNGAFRLHPVEWNVGEAAGMVASLWLEHAAQPTAL